jgi:sulfide:quinone oxidoreductase
MNDPKEPVAEPATGEDTTPSRRRFTRRTFLKGAGVGAGVTVLAAGGGYLYYVDNLKIPDAEAREVRKRHIVIAGGSIGGLTVAAQMMRAVPDANITIIEPNSEHMYQVGFTLVGAGVFERSDVEWKEEDLMVPGVKWVQDYIEAFDPENDQLTLRGGDTVSYDYLVVSLGVEQNPDSVEGWEDAMASDRVSNVYSIEGAQKYWEMMREFDGGTAVFTYPKGYVKCGGAPQKMTWLSEDKWRDQGKRDAADIHYFTPAGSMFPSVTKIDDILTPMTIERGIQPHWKHELKAIDVSTRTAIFLEEKEDGSTTEVRQQYDLLHAMLKFRTPKVLRESELTNEELNGQLEVDKGTLQHKRFANIFGVGDNTAIGVPKVAATIRKQAPVVRDNLIDAIMDRELSATYDGASGCPLLTRYGRCMMIEFDYEGNLVNEDFYDSTDETRRWWEFKVHGFKRLYKDVMIKGYEVPF